MLKLNRLQQISKISSLNRYSLFILPLFFSYSIVHAADLNLIDKKIRAYDKNQKAVVEKSVRVLDLTSGIEGASRVVSDFIKNQITASSCNARLSILNDSLFYIQSAEFLDMARQNGQMRNDAITRLFDSRLTLNQQLRAFVDPSSGSANFENRAQMESCVNEMRKTHRNLRNLEDRIALTSYLNSGKFQKPPALTGMPSADLGLKPFVDNEWPKLMVNPNFNSKREFSLSDLKSGDVLLTKGTTFASAVISRIGQVDNQFSHLALVYIDEKGELFGEKNAGKAYVVESEPDFGLQIVSLEHFLKNDKNRILVYRYSPIGRDSSLTNPSDVAERAARFAAKLADVRLNPYDKQGLDTTMRDRLDVFRKQTGQEAIPRIGYNFEMDMNIESTLFCSQVISWAYKNACTENGVECQKFEFLGNNGPELFPLLQSKIVTQNNGFAKMLELKISETFAPADFEVEPRFELLAEWRDVNYSAYTRIQDLATTKLFQLMEEGGYEFIETPRLKAFADAATKLLKDQGKMPENMPDGLTKGSLYTAFLTWHPGLSQLAIDMVGGLKPESLSQILQNALGVQEDTLQMIFDAMAQTRGEDSSTIPLSQEEQLTIMKELVDRFAQHVSFIKIIQDVEEKQIQAALSDKKNNKLDGFRQSTFMTERAMSSVIDEVRRQDCELLKLSRSGQKISQADLQQKRISRSNLIWHDLIHIPQIEAASKESPICITEPLELGNF